MHEVLKLIEERVRTGSRPGQRTDDYRIVLSVEGGGMRGTVSAGMALALHELGLVSAFDAVYGSSAGALTGAWLVSSEPDRLRGWADPDYAKTLIRWSSLLRGRPVVDVRGLVEEVYQTVFPMDFASILASPVEYHPLGTDAESGESTDLRPLISTPAELRLALRASASLPFLAGPPVELRGQRFYDAGVAESIPFRTPHAQGATHILVLRSRRPFALGAPVPHANGSPAPRPPRSIRLLARTTLAQRVAGAEDCPAYPSRAHRGRRGAPRPARGRGQGVHHLPARLGAADQPPDDGRPPARRGPGSRPRGRPRPARRLSNVRSQPRHDRGDTRAVLVQRWPVHQAGDH